MDCAGCWEERVVSPGVCMADQAPTTIRWDRGMLGTHSQALNGEAREQRERCPGGNKCRVLKEWPAHLGIVPKLLTIEGPPASCICT